MKKTVLLGILTLFLISFVSAECVIPYDGMVITENTTFCQGEYSFPNGISIQADNVVLDCDNSILKNENNSTSYIYPGRDNSYFSGGMIVLIGDDNVIKNCIILNSSTGIIDRIWGVLIL